MVRAPFLMDTEMDCLLLEPMALVRSRKDSALVMSTAMEGPAVSFGTGRYISSSSLVWLQEIASVDRVWVNLPPLVVGGVERGGEGVGVAAVAAGGGAGGSTVGWSVEPPNWTEDGLSSLVT